MDYDKLYEGNKTSQSGSRLSKSSTDLDNLEPIDWETAAPELRDRLYHLAKFSDDPKVVLPVFLAIAKMFPDNQVENKVPDIREIMKILTDEQLSILEKQCK